MINKHKEYTANEVSLDKEFSLSPGQSTMIAGENLAIKFIEVISDGRCPKGAICVWAGEARCLALTDCSRYKASLLTIISCLRILSALMS